MEEWHSLFDTHVSRPISLPQTMFTLNYSICWVIGTPLLPRILPILEMFPLLSKEWGIACIYCPCRQNFCPFYRGVRSKECPLRDWEIYFSMHWKLTKSYCQHDKHFWMRMGFYTKVVKRIATLKIFDFAPFLINFNVSRTAPCRI